MDTVEEIFPQNITAHLVAQLSGWAEGLIAALPRLTLALAVILVTALVV